MDDQAFEALMQESGLSDAVNAALTGAPPEQPTGNDESQATDQPAADAAPLESTPPTSPEPPAQPTVQPPNWETEENPYFTKAQKVDQFINTLHQRALTQREAQEQAAMDQLVEALPNLDPDKQQYVVRNLLAYKEQQAAARERELIQKYEQPLGTYVRKDIFSQYALDDDERKELEQFSDPRQIEYLAKKTHTVKTQAQQREEALRKELENIKANQVALTRRGTGVDTPVQPSGGIPSDAQSIDDLVASLNINWG